MARRRTSEESIAVEACRQLYRSGWTPYPELGGFADIAARHTTTGDVIALEVKATVNLKVVAQADRSRLWTRVAGVYVVVPAMTTYSRYLRLLCKELGIGVVEIQLTYRGLMSMTVTPAKRRGHNSRSVTTRDDLARLMIPEAEIYTIPGRKSPKSFTPFRLRELGLLRILEERPGLTYKELAQAEAEAAGKKKHASRAPTYIRELLERQAFTTFEADDDGKVWPRYAWGSKDAGHEAVDYSGCRKGALVVPSTLADPFTPLGNVDLNDFDLPYRFDAEHLNGPDDTVDPSTPTT